MVVTHRESGEQLCIGLEVIALPNLRESLSDVEACGADFLIGPLVHSRYERGFSTQQKIDASREKGTPQILRTDPFTRSDLELPSNEWSSGFIGRLSPWIRCDSESARLRSMSESALTQEIAVANHLALRAVITPPIHRGCSGANFSRTLYSALSSASSLNIWARIQLNSADDVPFEPSENGHAANGVIGHGETDAWDHWNKLRMMCDNHNKLGIALELTSNLPRNSLERWNGEPVRAVLVSTAAFVPNRHGFPVLPRRHQELIRQMFKYKCYFAITGSADKNESGDGLQPYVQYLGHLFGKLPSATDAERFEAPYYDYLQSPLQPLTDNLESSVYECFEKDPVKYEKYQEAVAKYLSTRQQAAIETQDVSASSAVTIMVLGAGRGPLVRACLKAAEGTKSEVKIYAVEKNPLAIVTLQNLVISEGWHNVEVIASDMRMWDPSEKADLMVSELLGSFGDNELSPECLDGAQKYLKDDGVSIPCAYTSYVAPLSSSRLYNEVRSYGESTASMETPYVVKIHRGYLLSAVSECFSFYHPNREEVKDNSRYTKLLFKASESSNMDGLAGFFEARLFDNVVISINPSTFSTGMFSWFPIFFPLRTPVQVKGGDAIEVHMWRKCTSTRVWYEWCVVAPHPVPIHNPNGRSSAMSLV
mmetsp:Transcript_9403/g.28346  ORF Transcript_9403/g.28346 Transcript_9403/m.28346 type:complete len:651 (-) Transcript_9403:1001-2953(-)